MSAFGPLQTLALPISINYCKDIVIPLTLRLAAKPTCRPRNVSTTPFEFWSVAAFAPPRSEEHTSELQSRENLVCRLLLEKKKKNQRRGLLEKKKKQKK